MAYVVAAMVEVLEQDQHHLELDCKKEIDTFLAKARSWRDILLQSPFEICGDVLNDDDSNWRSEFSDRRPQLRVQLIKALHRAEDEIEAHIRNQIIPSEDDDVDSQLDLAYVVEDIESIMEELSGICNGCRKFFFFFLVCSTRDRWWWAHDYRTQPSLPVDHLVSKQVPWYPKLDHRTKNDVPIFEEDFRILKSGIIGRLSRLQIMSIDGVIGMGKRTLARKLYNDLEIASHFRTRAWLSSPLEINEKSCLLNLLEGLAILTAEMRQKNVNELKVQIRNTLKNIKYFIVIHDIMHKENYVTFSKLFRDDHVGARVLFTTFDLKSSTISTYGKYYPMRTLTNSESWFLLRHKIFGSEHCPDELEDFGIVIMHFCKGNPLVVSMVAGVLATCAKTLANWRLVAMTMHKKLNSEIIDIQADLLGLIYHHLPHYLRPCLLYIGAFYEPRDIKASKIIKLWIGEGFVKQNAGECIEDVADAYLKILIDKNLISVTAEESNGRVQTFRVPTIFKVFYSSMAKVDNFQGSKFMCYTTADERENRMRRVSAHWLCEPSVEMDLPTLARSFLSVSSASRRQVSIYLKLRLLRVLEVFQLEFYQFPMEILQQVLLRYLAFSCHSNIPSSFSILRNLQTFIVSRISTFRAFSLPSNLWRLTQVRHIKCKETFVLIYPKNEKEIVHQNLQTLSNMQLLGVSNEFLRQIPNIRNLGIFCNIAMGTVFDLACLDKLETLKCSSNWSLASRNFLSFLTLPHSLRKLNLTLCRISLEFMRVVGSLPNLELLKLQKSDFVAVSSVKTEPKWETAEGEFPQLLSLEMLDLNLMHWKAKATHFPRIRHLHIENCYAMLKIPSDIGNIKCLELIQVNETSPSALVSAMEIKREQVRRGNKLLQVRTHKVVV